MFAVLSDCITSPLSRLSILRPLAPAGSASAVTIQGPTLPVFLAHVPLRGVALEFADRALVGAGKAGDAGQRVVERHMFRALADHGDKLGPVIEGFRRARSQQ